MQGLHASPPLTLHSHATAVSGLMSQNPRLLPQDSPEAVRLCSGCHQRAYSICIRGGAQAKNEKIDTLYTSKGGICVKAPCYHESTHARKAPAAADFS